MYNLTGMIDNTTTITSFVVTVNDNLMFGWLGLLLLIGIAVVLFTSFQYSTNDSGKSFTATSYICFVISLLFTALGILNERVAIICLMCCAGAIALSWRHA